jgi:hypothetical protein
MSTLKPKPQLTVTIPERQVWQDPMEPEVYVRSPEPMQYCPLCKHTNSGPNAKSTITSPSYMPTEPTYGDAPASPIELANPQLPFLCRYCSSLRRPLPVPRG